jgi:hypothetical protein
MGPAGSCVVCLVCDSGLPSNIDFKEAYDTFMRGDLSNILMEFSTLMKLLKLQKCVQ